MQRIEAFNSEAGKSAKVAKENWAEASLREKMHGV